MNRWLSRVETIIVVESQIDITKKKLKIDLNFELLLLLHIK